MVVLAAFGIMANSLMERCSFEPFSLLAIAPRRVEASCLNGMLIELLGVMHISIANQPNMLKSHGRGVHTAQVARCCHREARNSNIHS